MSTIDILQSIGIVASIVFGVASLWYSIRAQRATDDRQRATDEWEESISDYADHIVDGLNEHVNAGNLYPEYEVPRHERKLAHAAVQRGLLNLGTISGHVTLPGREATPTVNAVGLYQRGGIFD